MPTCGSMEDWNQSIQMLMRRFNDSIYFLTLFSNLLKKFLQVPLETVKTSLFVQNTTVEVLYQCKLIRWTDVADVKEVLVLNTYGAWWTKWWFEISLQKNSWVVRVLPEEISSANSKFWCFFLQPHRTNLVENFIERLECSDA